MKVISRFFISVAIIFFAAGHSHLAAENQLFKNTPEDYKGKKWRIGYYQGGDYGDYPLVLMSTIKGLMELGWIEKDEIPSPLDGKNRSIWDWLATKAKSKYLEFVDDAFYTTNWTNYRRKEITEEIINRFSEKKDIDLMFAFGTWAGQDLANNRHQIPTFVFSVSEPISAGIIKSVEDSGFDHVHSRIDPERYERQVRIFHDIIRFKRLGLVYDNTEAGRTYGAIEKVERVAKELNFKLVRCFAKAGVTRKRIAENNMIDCWKQLKGKVDAIYVTKHLGVQLRSIPELIMIANSARIPTFSQTGSEEVKYGFLLSIATASMDPLGRFHAEALGKVFNGAKPRQVGQFFESPQRIAINLETAEAIGYEPPVDVISAADEVYLEIQTPEPE